MPRCQGITKAGARCKHRYRTADPGLKRSRWYCDQHASQRERYANKTVDAQAVWIEAQLMGGMKVWGPLS